MLILLLRHLFYFSDQVWPWVLAIQPFGDYAAVMMLSGLAGLWCRRFLVDRLRYISNLSDHLMLALLIGIAASGLAMNYFDHPNIIAVKAYIQGLITFNWQPLPPIPFLMLHLALVAMLLIVFPLSKLLHAPGVFFSPAINQVDNPRESRWLSGWSAQIEHTRGKKHYRTGVDDE
jgi:nitrate reductase gamma subunit